MQRLLMLLLVPILLMTADQRRSTAVVVPPSIAGLESELLFGEPVHPLDPLTANEIRTAVEVVRATKKLPERVRFQSIVLHEPPKTEVLAFAAGKQPFRRDARLIILDATEKTTHEAIVDLRKRHLAQWRHLPNVQPPALLEEYDTVATLVKQDARWQAAMKRRGILQFDQVQVDAWTPGPVQLPDRSGHRFFSALSYFRGTSGNPYASPIEGVVALVDMTKREVVWVHDPPAVPIPNNRDDFFHEEVRRPLVPSLKPLTTAQPEGPSFVIRRQEVEWENWRFRCSLHPREGLVLHTVARRDGDSWRSILYRGSMAEMVVPYGDTDFAWHWRNAFDEGEYGLGLCATRLRPGHEVPAHATLLPALFAGETGVPYLRKQMIGIWEQDDGILWTHSDYLTNETITRRARRLYVFMLFTVGNYDYGLSWIFGQDGSIEIRVELHGILLAKGVIDDKCPICKAKPDADGRTQSIGSDRYGALVAKHVVAVNHQHHFCFRLDLDIDGPTNRVQESDVVRAPLTADNPARNGFLTERRTLPTELEARRSAGQEVHRQWQVVSSERRGALGHPTGYALDPGPMPPLLPHPESTLARRTGFLRYPFWVTKFKQEERYPAGDFPTQWSDSRQLGDYASDNESIVDEDVVVWYTIGVTHIARPEEWPIMPATRIAFRLIPHGFYDRNPALGVQGR